MLFFLHFSSPSFLSTHRQHRSLLLALSTVSSLFCCRLAISLSRPRYSSSPLLCLSSFSSLFLRRPFALRTGCIALSHCVYVLLSVCVPLSVVRVCVILILSLSLSLLFLIIPLLYSFSARTGSIARQIDSRYIHWEELSQPSIHYQPHCHVPA